ncbi:hypothetical protein VTO73DRAFT_9831 [Trametes versicolor]
MLQVKYWHRSSDQLVWLSTNSVFVGISAATTQLTVVCSSTAIGNGCNTGSACITYPTAQKPNNRTTTDLRELRSPMSALFPRISPVTPAASGQQPLDSTFGAFLIGNFPLWSHIASSPSIRIVKTEPHLRHQVTSAVLLETCSSVLGIHSCYFYLVTNHSLPLREAFTVGLWSLNGLAIDFNKPHLARFAALCTAATAKTFIVDDGAKTRPVLANLISRAFLLALVADCLLTVMLVHVLHNSRTGIKSTNSMIDVMIIYSVRTGLLTGIFDLLTTIFAFVRPTDNAYIAIGLPGARMYAITLLAALNSRQSIAARASSIDEDTTAFGTVVLSPIAFSGTRNSRLHTRSVRRFFDME